MAYVDLNPIRAGINQTPETSDFTSIQQRIQSYQENLELPDSLVPFVDEINQIGTRNTGLPSLPYAQLEYFELVDLTGRLVKEGKRGSIPSHLKPILERLNIRAETWSKTITRLGRSFACFMGRPESIERCMIVLNRPKLKGLKQAKLIFNS